MSFTYSDVDRSADPAEALAWQRKVDSWSTVLAYKARIRSLLEGVTPILDVGCGPGEDAVKGAGFAIGIDRSEVICKAASEHGPVCRADGHRLPFAASSFGGICADRVLQHVDRPDNVLAEMSRVLRPGGRLVVADPDQETLTIRIPGVPQHLVDRVKALRRDVGYRNGRLVGTLPDRLGGLGMTNLSIEGYVLTLTDPADAFGLPTWLSFWRDAGHFTDADEQLWTEATRQGGAPGFVYAVTYFVVAATKPR